MKIIHVLRKYNPDEWGGIETHLLDLWAGLKPQGFQFIVYAPKITTPESHQQDPLSQAGIQVKRYSAFLPSIRLSQKNRNQLISIGGNLFSFSLLFQLIKEQNTQTIHCHTLKRIGGIAALAARLKNVPLIISVHGGYSDLPGKLRKTMSTEHHGGIDIGQPLGWLVGSRKLFSYAAKVITFNQIEQQSLTTLLDSKKVIQLPHAVPVTQQNTLSDGVFHENFPQLKGTPYILCVARIDPTKQQDLLITALAQLAPNNPDLNLVLAGGITNQCYYQQLQRQVSELNLAEKVIFTGQIQSRSTKLSALYQRAKACALVSKHEPLGITVLEAWSNQTAVVATRTSGANELITDQKNGLLCDGSAEDIREKIQRLLSDTNLREKIQASALNQVVEHNSIEIVADQYRRMYQLEVNGVT